MQVNIGEKIKELRKRDGRKQEDLANALGVTPQAISRWESNVCYPDMNLIPAIANYFHVSIDLLFGYSNDREVRIKECTNKVNRFFIENDMTTSDVTHIIEMLRSSLNEFPEEPELLRLLAMSLSAQGQKESEKPNKYLAEAADIYEVLLKENSSVICQLLDIYTTMGDYEKAEKKAQEQPSIQICREILLASAYQDKNAAFEGKKGKQYQGEAILSLLHELKMIITRAVARNDKLHNSKEGLAILAAVRNLYEAIFGGEGFGKFHSDMCMLDLSCARIAGQIKEYDQVYSYFDSAYKHYIEHEKTMIEGKNENGITEESFEAPLLEEVGVTSIPIVVCRTEFFMYIINSLPENIKTELLYNPQYASLFA